MSTKTNFKRVALVAVAALGLGVLTSVAPASAAGTGLTFEPNGVTAGNLSTGICSYSNTTGATVASGASIKVDVTGTAATTDVVAVTGPLYIANSFDTSDGTPGIPLSVGTGSSIFLTAGDDSVVINATGVGSGTITLFNGTTFVKTLPITVVASCSSGVGTAYSFVQVSDSSSLYYTAADLAEATPVATTWDDISDADTSADRKTSFANAANAYVAVNVESVYGADLTTGYITLTATNGALVNGVAGGTTAGITHSYGNTFTISQPTPGVALSTAVTVSYNGTVLATKNITIKGDASSLTGALGYSGLSGQAADATAATALQGIIAYSVKDAAGNGLTNSGSLYTVSLYSSDNPALVNQATHVRYNLESTTPTKGGLMVYNCIGATKSGTANLVLAYVNGSGVRVKSAPIAVTCSGTTASYKIALDKASYKSGDIATLTISGLDANGAAVADNTTLGNGYSASVAVPGMTVVAAPVSTDASSGGSWTYTYTVNAGLSGGYAAAVTIAGATVQVTPATTQYSITDGSSGVSNADVLKAIVSLIASINKQIAALQKALLKK